MLASHDGDFAPEVEALLGTDRRVGLLAFREFTSTSLAHLADRGLGRSTWSRTSRRST